ncbi:MAG TPA: acetate/propionate family kinase [Streptosporangiaceae bacterium]|nr:acetate/propionate family kinase [Streptosporangiaceae bacterium]
MSAPGHEGTGHAGGRQPGRPELDPVLVVNTGSSSLKLSVLRADDTVADRCDIDPWDGSADAPRLRAYLDTLAGRGTAVRPAAVGHRVVHGGTRFTSAALIDETVLAGIADLTPLAPLHQPRALAGIAATMTTLGDLPQVACFDTAFHRTLPPRAATYPLPADWRQAFGLRKFGFHGLSHSYAARRAAQLLDIPESRQIRAVTCHLGAGSSLAAVQGGRSVETTMGFTPLDGLVMATRCGSIDPGLIAWLAADRVPAAELAAGLEHRSGLAGLAGLPDGSGDIRAVIAAAQRGDQDARLALDVHGHRLVAAVAAMAAAMNGIDLLVFTGGIGEHQPAVRTAAAAGLRFLGVGLDPDRNAAASADADITAEGARVRTVVVSAREDIEVARSVRALVAGLSSWASVSSSSAGRSRTTPSPSTPSCGDSAAT